MRHIKTTTHRILAVICFSIILSGFRAPATSEPAASFYTTDTTTDAKLAAFEILKARCNGCHIRQNPAKVFTKNNMNSLAPTIYEQVFIRKRMPRGNKVRLTEHEYNILRNWLIIQNIK